MLAWVIGFDGQYGESRENDSFSRYLGMYDSYPPMSWRVRSISIAVVVLLHVALLFVTFEKAIKPSNEPTFVVQTLPFEAPPPQVVDVALPRLMDSAPPQVAAPEIAVEIVESAPPTTTLLIADAPTAPAGNGVGDHPNGGLSGGGNAGDGAGSGASAFTKCSNRSMPIYPNQARMKGEQGTVTLLVQLDERGRFSAVTVARSSGSTALDDAAIDAVKRWRCSPVYHLGKPIPALTKQEFEFKLPR